MGPIHQHSKLQVFFRCNERRARRKFHADGVNTLHNFGVATLPCSSSWKLPNPCCRGGAAIHESSVVVESENSIRKMTPFPALAAFKSFFCCCSAAEKEKKEKALGSFMLESVECAMARWRFGWVCRKRREEGHGTKWAGRFQVCPVVRVVYVSGLSLFSFFLCLVSSFLIPSLSRPSLFAVSFSLSHHC